MIIMKAIVLENTCKAEDLKVSEIDMLKSRMTGFWLRL